MWKTQREVDMYEVRDLAFPGLRVDETVTPAPITDRKTEEVSYVSGQRRLFRDGMINGADHRVWDKTFSGAGAAVNDTRNQVQLVSGTASGGFAQLLSKETFTAPMRVSILHTLSARIANQLAFIEMVSIGANGEVDEQNVIGWQYDGTVATQGIYRVGNFVSNVLASSASTISDTGTLAHHEFELHTDEARFFTQVVDSNSGKNVTYRRTQRLPDPSTRYKLRIRIQNAAAVASTNFNIAQVAVEMFSKVPVEITDVPDGAGNAFGFQVWNVNALTVAGAVARNATSPNNPLYIMTGVSAWPALITTGRNVEIIADLIGRPAMLPYSIPDTTWSAFVVKATTADEPLRAAGAAGIRNYITGLQLSNSSATGTEVLIKDNAATIWRGWLPPNSSIGIEFPVPLRGSAATVVNVGLSAAVTSVYINAQGFTAPV
jgi:hypothetical protein